MSIKKIPTVRVHKALDITDKPSPETFKVGYAHIVYKNNHDGTYYILKSRNSRSDIDVSAEELIALLAYLVNNPVH